MDQKTEIRSYIKCRIRLNIESKQIFNELCGIYGSQTISMHTGFKWVKSFKAGKFSVEDDTRPGRIKTSLTKAYSALRHNRQNRCPLQFCTIDYNPLLPIAQKLINPY